MDVLPKKEKENVAGYPSLQLMHCTSGSGTKMVCPVDPVEDTEVNIMDMKDHGSIGEAGESRADDTAESMSSFGNTESDTESGSALSDNEVESEFCDRGALNSMFSNCGGALGIRRKKLTDHWRRFIRPLMWRCKWIELQINEFQSQEVKYKRELAEHEQMKSCDYERIAIGGESSTRSLSLPSSIQRRKVMKRKKRKRVDETTDVALYMLQHNLFSYSEKKKSNTNGTSIDDHHINLDKMAKDFDELGPQEGWGSLKLRESDNASEELLRKIEVVQSQVREMKAQIDKVISENTGKFNSFNSTSSGAPSEVFTSSDQNIASLPENGDSLSVTSLHKIGEFNPDSDISGMIENVGDTQDSKSSRPLLSVKIEDATDRQDAQLSGSESPMNVPVNRVHCTGKYLQWPRSNSSGKKRKRGRERSRAGWQNQKR